MKYINKTLKTHCSSAFKFSNYSSHPYSWLRSLRTHILNFSISQLSYRCKIIVHSHFFFFTVLCFLLTKVQRSSGMSGSLALLGGHTTPLVGGKGGFGRRSLSSLLTVSCKEAYFSWRALCSASFLWP